MHITISRKKTGMALLASVFLILFFVPSITVHGQTQPQPLPSSVQVCSPNRFEQAFPLFELGSFSMGSIAKDIQANLTVSGVFYNVEGNPVTNGTFKIGSATGTLTNLTTSKQVGTFRASGINVDWRIPAYDKNLTIFGVSVTSLYFDVTPAIQRELRLPVDYLTLSGLGLTIVLDCSNKTYSTSYTASVSPAGIIQSLLKEGPSLPSF